MTTQNNQKAQTISISFLISAILIAMIGCNEPANVAVNRNKPTTVNNDQSSIETNQIANNSTGQPNYKNSDNPLPINNILSFEGLGKAKIGMTISEASKALDTELVRGEGYEDSCYYVESNPSLDGVRFMVTNEKIARIDISGKEYVTDKGVAIGDPETKVKSLYKNVEVHPQKYDDQKNDMEVYSDDKKSLIIFETDGKTVTGFRAGNAEEVGFVEGCS